MLVYAYINNNYDFASVPHAHPEATRIQGQGTVGFYLQGKGHNLTFDLPLQPHSLPSALLDWNLLLWIQLESKTEEKEQRFKAR